MRFCIVLICLVVAAVCRADAGESESAPQEPSAPEVDLSRPHNTYDIASTQSSRGISDILDDLDEARSLRWCGATGGSPDHVIDGLMGEERLLEELSRNNGAGVAPPSETAITAASVLVGGGRYSEGLKLLESAFAEEVSGDALFLRGLCLEKLGRCGEAAEAYGPYAAAGGLLGDYALLFAARCLHGKGGTSAAVDLLRRLVGRWKHSPLWDEGALQLCTYYIDSGRHEECIELARRISSEASSGSSRRTAQYHMARAMVKSGMNQEAAAAFWSIVKNHPSHSKAGQSYRAYVSVKRLLHEEISPGEMFLGAKALQNTGNLKEAHGVLKKLVSRGDAGAYRQKGAVEMAALDYRRRHYTQAAKEYEALMDDEGMKREEAQLWLGKALIRSGRTGRGLEVLESLGGGDGSAGLRAEALWEVGRERESLGEFEKAAESYRLVSESLPGTSPAVASGWRLAFCLYLQGDWAGALDAFDSAKGAARANHRKAQALYWKAKALGRLNRVEEAEENLRQAASVGANVYYGARAAWVIRTGLKEFEAQSFEPGRDWAPAPDSAAGGSVPAPDSTSGLVSEAGPDTASASGAPCEDLLRGYPGGGGFPEGTDPAVDPSGWHLSRGMRLLAWGADRRGALELRRAVASGYSKAKAIETLYFYGAYNQAMKMGGDLPPQHVSAPGEDDMYMKYPLGYAAEVWRRSDQSGLSPFLSLALIRQESRFDPGAVSYAGAYGLMQLMPATAKRLSREAGVRWRGARQTLDPALNVRLGTLELAGLYEDFEGLPVVLSAYNAGPARARRWSAAAGDRDLDCYIEMIGFRQTRDYVKLVIRDYLIYLRLYDGSWGPH
jgi:soluble lytic murein transglycosylase